MLEERVGRGSHRVRTAGYGMIVAAAIVALGVLVPGPGQAAEAAPSAAPETATETGPGPFGLTMGRETLSEVRAEIEGRAQVTERLAITGIGRKAGRAHLKMLIIDRADNLGLNHLDRAELIFGPSDSLIRASLAFDNASMGGLAEALAEKYQPIDKATYVSRLASQDSHGAVALRQKFLGSDRFFAADGVSIGIDGNRLIYTVNDWFKIIDAAAREQDQVGEKEASQL